jgi:hypothetical protein
LRLRCWVLDGKERRLPVVSPNRVDFGVLESTGEHELRPRNVNRISVLDQQGASLLHYLQIAE